MHPAVAENKNTVSGEIKNYSAGNFIVAVGGITIGLILMATGLILSIVSFFENADFHGGEVLLLVAAFVLLAVGAHFLDRLEKEKKAKRIEFCRRNGLSDEECV